MSDHSPLPTGAVLAVALVLFGAALGGIAVLLLTNGDGGDQEATATAPSSPPSAPAPSASQSASPSESASEETETTVVVRDRDEFPSATVAGEFDFDAWLQRIPARGSVGGEEVDPGQTYAFQAFEDVSGITAIGGSSAAIRAHGPVSIVDAELGGAADGLKPATGTTLADAVVTVDYGEGAHADHVQIRAHDRVRMERLRLIAENTAGATDVGWNAAIFIHEGSTDWIIRDVYVQAAEDPALEVTSWYPIRLAAGSGVVDGLVVDRAAMKGETAVQVIEGAEIVEWRDVYIREDDGSLTPVPDPRG